METDVRPQEHLRSETTLTLEQCEYGHAAAEEICEKPEVRKMSTGNHDIGQGSENAGTKTDALVVWDCRRTLEEADVRTRCGERSVRFMAAAEHVQRTTRTGSAAKVNSAGAGERGKLRTAWRALLKPKGQWGLMK